MSTVLPAFRCPECRTIYDTKAEALACASTPIVPPGVKYMTEGLSGASWCLWEVREVRGAGCRQVVSVRPHPAFRPDMPSAWGLSSGGACYVQERGTEPRRRPITPEM